MSNGGADQRRHLRWLVASSSWYPLKLPISPLGVWFSASRSMARGQQDRLVDANGIALLMRRLLT